MWTKSAAPAAWSLSWVNWRSPPGGWLVVTDVVGGVPVLHMRRVILVLPVVVPLLVMTTFR